MPPVALPLRKPKKLIRQIDAEKSFGEGANPSQLGDPVSLEIESNVVQPQCRRSEDTDGSWPAYRKPSPGGSAGKSEKADDSDTGYAPRMAGLDMIGKLEGCDNGLDDRHRMFKL